MAMRSSDMDQVSLSHNEAHMLKKRDQVVEKIRRDKIMPRRSEVEGCIFLAVGKLEKPTGQLLNLKIITLEQ